MSKDFFRLRKRASFTTNKYRLYLYSDDYTTIQYIGWDDNSDSECFKIAENATTVSRWDTYSELYEALFKT